MKKKCLRLTAAHRDFGWWDEVMRFVQHVAFFVVMYTRSTSRFGPTTEGFPIVYASVQIDAANLVITDKVGMRMFE